MKNEFILLFTTVLSLALSSCSNSEKNLTANNTKQVAQLITEAQIFEPQILDSVQKIATLVQKIESKKYYLQGLDLLANKGDASASVEFFVQSILYCPNDKAYYELGVAFNTMLAPDSAIRYFEFAGSFLSFEPYYDISYGTACSYAIKQDTSAAIAYLREAMEAGFLNKERLMKERCFENFKETESFMALVAEYFSDEVKLRGRVFAQFAKSFRTINQPYVISKDSVSNFDFNSYINYDYAMFITGMEDSRFARDVSNEYARVGRFNVNDSIVAIVYKSFLAIADTLNPVNSFVATYNINNGLMVEEMPFACFCSPLSIKTGEISNNTVRVKEFTRKWESDPLENGYAYNKVISEDFVAEEIFMINEDGRFIKQDASTIASKANK